MTFWPFTRPPPSLRLRALRRDVDELQAELIDLRETLEKVFAGIKKVQGKIYRRKRAEVEELGEPEVGGAESIGVSESAPPTGGPQLHPNHGAPYDLKADLRGRAALLRGRR